MGQPEQGYLLWPINDDQVREACYPPVAGFFLFPEGELMRTVLVVDDDNDIRKMLTQTLEREGFRVVATCDGQEALSYLQKVHLKPDVMLLDAMMPRMTGSELMKEMSKTGITLPVILQTGEKNLQLPGVRKYLSKPYSTSQLMEAIRSCLP